MQFIDLAAQQARIKDAIDERIQRVLAHGQYIKGPEVGELEEKLAAFTGAKHCIGVANGTDALQIALMAAGVGPGDEVITPGFTFIATAEAVAVVGARPVYIDIDEKTYNLDPDQLESLITPNTKAIIPVSLYGQCADFDAINAIAERHGLTVIEDAAQSLGASYKGRRSGNLSRIATTSFFPSKPLGAYGDGGALFYQRRRPGGADPSDRQPRPGPPLSPRPHRPEQPPGHPPGGHPVAQAGNLRRRAGQAQPGCRPLHRVTDGEARAPPANNHSLCAPR
jgi:UDP-2-acetamido-2-deoxy-ribo-hexuluronate aminotransferase